MMIDGVNTVFTVEHRRGAMEIEGHANKKALVGYLIETLHDTDPVAHLKWLESLPRLIEQTRARIKESWSIK